MQNRNDGRRARRVSVVALVLAAWVFPIRAAAQSSRAFAEREWQVKAEKMERHLQRFMRMHGIDLWIIMSHENHPDPVLDLFGGHGITGWYGHRNAYLIRDPGGEQPLERVVFGTHLSQHLEPFFPRLVGYGEEGLAPHLGEYVRLADPKRIAINQSRTISMADGISVDLMDVHWWIVDEWRRLGLDFNFPPGLSILRQGSSGLEDADDPVIEPGDVIHVDFGVRQSGIVTDQQKLAYVRRPGETEPPEGLRQAFARSARVADMIATSLVPGRLGHEVKTAAEAMAREEGIEALVYSHAQGNWVHDAGAWAIYDWPERYGTHPREPVRATEFWSIEFSATSTVPEWGGQSVRLGREEDAGVGEDGVVRFMTGPQAELWLIRSLPRPVS
jgi:hypothetical protein